MPEGQHIVPQSAPRGYSVRLEKLRRSELESLSTMLSIHVPSWRYDSWCLVSNAIGSCEYAAFAKFAFFDRRYIEALTPNLGAVYVHIVLSNTP